MFSCLYLCPSPVLFYFLSIWFCLFFYRCLRHNLSKCIIVFAVSVSVYTCFFVYVCVSFSESFFLSRYLCLYLSLPLALSLSLPQSLFLYLSLFCLCLKLCICLCVSFCCKQALDMDELFSKGQSTFRLTLCLPF